MKALILPLALLAACNQQAEAPTTNETAPAVAAKPAAPAPKAFAVDEKNELIEFHFAWSAEAAAVPKLVEQFRNDMAKAKAELLAGAREDKAMRDKEGYDFNPHTSSTDYKTAGQSARLLSLQGDIGSFTGGAHGNYGTSELLWDRLADKQVKFADLFAAAANMDRLLTQPWCDALNKAREQKRGEPVGGEGMFDECPPLSDVAIIPTDKDGNGKFERLQLIADPYVAGPYAEGNYEVELAVSGGLIAVLRSEYRESFEAQPQ
jgi:hypothetical protein